MHNNVPDDWGNFYRTCSKCTTRFHASDGGCPKCIDEYTYTDDEDDEPETDLANILS